MKNKKILFGTSMLAVIAAVATSCGQGPTHKINSELSCYNADMNHDGVIKDTEDGKETNLTWAEAYDGLLKQANSMKELNKAATKLNIADDEVKKCSLARYEILHEAEELLMSTNSIVPLYNYADPYLMKDNIYDLYATDLGYKFMDRIKDKSNPSKKDFAVSVGTRAESYDPAINSDASSANILVQVLTGAMRWVPNRESPCEGETKDRGIYNAKLEEGLCKVEKKLISKTLKDENHIPFGETELADEGFGEVADDWEGAARYTFTIKDGSVWNDGTKITADDFIYEWTRASSAVYNSTAFGIWNSLFDSIRGFNAWNVIGQQETIDTSKWSKTSQENWTKLSDKDKAYYKAVWNRKDPGATEINGRNGGMIGVMKNAENQFTVQLVNDSEYFLELLAFPAFMPIKKSNVFTGEKDKDGNYIETKKWALNVNNKFATSNTLEFDGKLPEQEGLSVKLKRAKNCLFNKEIEESGEQLVNTLTFKLIDDDTNMYEQYLDGQLVMIDAVASGIIDKVKKTSQWHLAPQIGLFYYIFNVNDNTFDVKNGMSERDREKFRRIMILLLNRYDLCENVVRTGVSAADGMVSKGITEKCVPVYSNPADPTSKIVAMTDSSGSYVTEEWQNRNLDTSDHFNDKWVGQRMVERNHPKSETTGFTGFYPVALTKEDESKAMKQSMKEAYQLAKELSSSCGLKVTGNEQDFEFENFPQVTILTNSGTGLESLAERIQAYYSLFNIKVTIETQEWQAFSATRRGGDYAFARHGWVADYNDPRTYLDLCRSTDGNNDTQLGKSGDNVFIHRSH